MKDKNKLWVALTFGSIAVTFLTVVLYFLKIINIRVVFIALGLTQIFSGANQLRGNKARMSTTNMIFSGLAIFIGIMIILFSFILT